eukprot:CAMPEP_0178841878 /NCGR_PEP_ID=MMETSP0746-20121128/15178_1 /TAXON_ID=913974 /ORGANISM="Nitzschia punctata, Strain CCMP561" /LENGTH=75 /DNA_ID=CAMNT_0020505115 /DNA_START=111 /DNA_END=338 /DNA_ORIENTATION=-
MTIGGRLSSVVGRREGEVSGELANPAMVSATPIVGRSFSTVGLGAGVGDMANVGRSFSTVGLGDGEACGSVPGDA